ncbi:NucA/NucB deoxyribonuclease domain-containing protein [Saccharibacillus sp. CPCC 101409]|uniref:NucA/NucB deoxyribonuclease domain-containing protein n=1 Tax=Saccharibacillus sp. CPCC 101409 TaxID=3058041 RepID=UPI002672C958|nr:NucA/NucB deoxyribonuclease domain-containing protein [Saccharibacillus sp. CPCC 101409]MDO3409243.1 NucA/NucB deoxyribonuclease domain-containing protein [Saccharibacillus sp. CPCC 101409]
MSKKKSSKKSRRAPSVITIVLVVLLALFAPQWLKALGPLLGLDLDFGGSSAPAGQTVRIEFPVERYPKTAAHIRKAIAAGESAVCTIDREGAEKNRQASLRGVPTKKGYDRDEWPMAMCEEGGSGANIAYVPPADNRGAGSWIGNQLDDYADGTRVEFIFR